MEFGAKQKQNATERETMTKLLFNIRLAEQFVLMYAFKRLFGFVD